MNLGYSNTLWQALWDRFLFACRLARSWVEQRDKHRNRRTQLVNLEKTPATPNITSCSLAGVRYRTNTSEEGKLFVRVTGAGPYQVSLYKATGGGAGNEVARATGVAASGTGALVAQNSSGVTGSVTLAGSVTAETDDVHFLRVYLDWRADADTTFDRTDAQSEDLKSLQSVGAILDRLQGRCDDAVNDCVELFLLLMVADPERKNDRAYGSKFLKEKFDGLISETIEEDARLRRGALESLRQAMVDETTGSTQSIIRRLVAAAAGVAATGNTGLGTIASHTPEAHCPTGTYTLTCVAGLGDDSGGVEEFEVTFASDLDDRTKTHAGRLTVGQAFQGEDGFGGASFAILRTFSKTGDGSNLNFSASLASWTTAGERESNTNSGVLYWKIVQESTLFAVEFYKAASMQAGDLVARSTAVAAAGAFQAVQRRGSQLTINGTLGSGPVNGATGTFLFNFFTTRNSVNRPDSFTVVVSLTSSGLISKILAALPFLAGNGAKLNGVASGGQLINDGLAYANTWEPFVVEVN